METKAFDAPALYGDHHVSEVRRILMELPGVIEIYASSAFRAIEVTFDEKKINGDKIAASLEEAGYLGEIPTLTETGIPAYGREDGDAFFRHTDLYATLNKTIAFAQDVQYQGRPLWPCPGFGPVKTDK